jgi:WD40 repeat protein
VLRYHFIRSGVSGEVKEILRHPGEAVKSQDTILVVHDNRRLRVETRLDYQYARRIKKDDVVVVEPSQPAPPSELLRGHTEKVTGVAVSMNGEVVSSSEDRSVRVWDRKARQDRLILRHPVAVLCVACSPTANLCVSGGADGLARVWDLSGNASTPVELQDGHRRAINCVTFSPDGKWCVTGGDDQAICLWDVEAGKLLHRFPSGLGHKGGVTSVQFLSGPQDGKLYLISAGRGDQTLLAWPLAANGAPETARSFGRRSGHVNVLGVNAAGRQVLFDQERELRVISLPDMTLSGTLSSGGATNFNTMALFSPDGNLILTAGGHDGRLQLWRAPNPKTRGYELRHLGGPTEGRNTTSGAFAPDGSFLVTGTSHSDVIVWPVPSKKEVETQFLARIVFVDDEVNLASRQVRVHAELDNRWFEVTPRALEGLKNDPALKQATAKPEEVIERLKPLAGKEFASEAEFEQVLAPLFQAQDLARLRELLLRHAEKAGPLHPGNTATLVVYPSTVR